MSHKSPKSPKTLEVIGKSGGIKLDDIDLEQLTAISVPIKKRINALKNEQVKLLDLEKQFFEELHQLECKFAKLSEPIYEKRRKIVIGDLEPTEEEAKWALDDKEEAAEAEDKKTDEEKNGEEKAAELTESGKKLLNDLKEQFNVKKSGNEKGIPNFWLETLQASRITSEMIQEHDEPVLAFLQDVRVKMHDQKPYGYTIEFEFAENPYFTNKVLTKTFELKMDLDAKDPFSFEGPDLERCVGCKIDWKPNKNVTVRLVKKKIKGRNKKAPPKVITKEEKQESFFTFFETRPETSGGKAGGHKNKNRNTSESGGESSSGANKQLVKSNSNHPDEENEEDEDEMDEETAHDLYLMTEFETGQYLKDKIIPKAVLYFSGELDDLDEDDYEDGEDYDDEDEDDDDEDDDDEDEDDDDDDDDNDDDDENPKGKKGGHSGAKGGKKGGKQGGAGGQKGEGKPGEPTPSECKQN